jgi:hypothetical protein
MIFSLLQVVQAFNGDTMNIYSLTSKSSWRGSHMVVTTSAGFPVLEVKGKWFSFLGQRYSVFDAAQNRIGVIRQVNTIASMKYMVNFGGRNVGEIYSGRVFGLASVRHIVIEHMPALKMETPWGWKFRDSLQLKDEAGVFTQISIKGPTWEIAIMRECCHPHLLAAIATFYPDCRYICD